jgi:hypothetical protein
MLGQGGLFRQENVEKRRIMSVREWAELCAKPDLKAPGVNDVGLRKADTGMGRKRRTRRGEAHEEDDGEAGEQREMEAEEAEQGTGQSVEVGTLASHSVGQPNLSKSQSTSPQPEGTTPATPSSSSPKKPKSKPQSRESREASLAERAAKDTAFINVFNPHTDWLPKDTKAEDFNADFCTKLERQYWRNCGLGKAAWYGADTQGSLSFLISCDSMAEL